MEFVCISIDDKKYELPIGSTLINVAVENINAIPFRCKQGICGTCCVKIINGITNINIQSDTEKEFLCRMGYYSSDIRLACQIKVFGAVQLKVYNY